MAGGVAPAAEAQPWRSALGARRSALGARRSALGARRSALGARRSALGARRSALGARRSALGARRSALGARRSALGARRSALGARRSALGARRSALGARHCTRSRSVLQCQPFIAVATDDHTFSPPVNGNRIAAVLWRARTSGCNPTADPTPLKPFRQQHGYMSPLVRLHVRSHSIFLLAHSDICIMLKPDFGGSSGSFGPFFPPLV